MLHISNIIKIKRIGYRNDTYNNININSVCIPKEKNAVIVNINYLRTGNRFFDKHQSFSYTPISSSNVFCNFSISNKFTSFLEIYCILL